MSVCFLALRRGRAAVLAMCLVGLAGQVRAGNSVEAACLLTGGPGAPADFCTCMQKVADVSLSAADQKFAAYFLRNPGRAAEIRRSNPAGRRDFWHRFEVFAGAARRHCVGATGDL